MSARLIFAIISTLLEETAIAAVVLLGLPHFDINLPLAVLRILMVVWGAYSIVIYRVGSRALMQKPTMGLPEMIGSRARVVSPLGPEGLVKIKGELWMAKLEGSEANLGEEVTVVGQDGLKLFVHRISVNDSETTESG